MLKIESTFQRWSSPSLSPHLCTFWHVHETAQIAVWQITPLLIKSVQCSLPADWKHLIMWLALTCPHQETQHKQSENEDTQIGTKLSRGCPKNNSRWPTSWQPPARGFSMAVTSTDEEVTHLNISCGGARESDLSLPCKYVLVVHVVEIVLYTPVLSSKPNSHTLTQQAKHTVITTRL